MASSRRAGGAIEHVSTFGGAGRNYTSLATWESDYTVDLTTSNKVEVLECYNDAASYDQNVVIAGATTDATRFRIIRPAPGSGTNGANFHGGLPTAGIRIFSTTEPLLSVILISESYCQIQDIVVKLTTNTANIRSIMSTETTGTNMLFIDCMAVDGQNAGSGSTNGFLLNNLDNCGCINCLAHNCDRYGINAAATAAGIDVYVYNCTATENGIAGSYSNFRIVTNNATATCTFKNNLALTPLDVDFQGAGASGTKTVIYCSSADATADDWAGAGNRINQIFTFKDLGNNDFHLRPNDRGALGFGTDLRADATFAFDDDIDKGMRLNNRWDIGFDQHRRRGIL